MASVMSRDTVRLTGPASASPVVPLHRNFGKKKSTIHPDTPPLFYRLHFSSVCSSTHTYKHLPVHSSPTNPSTHSNAYLTNYTYLSVHLPSSHPAIYLPIHQPTCPPVYPSTRPPVYLSTHPPVYLSTNPPSTHPTSAHLPMPTTHPSFHTTFTS